jgi:hypothetical protein
MRRRFLRSVCRPVFWAALVPVSALAQTAAPDRWEANLEWQWLQTSRNAIQKPNTSAGDRFDASEFTGRANQSQRFWVTRPVAWWGREGGEFRWVAAPFEVSGTTRPARSIRFEDSSFQAGEPTHLLYRFNTYRFTYSEPVWPEHSGRWALRLGATLALRDARIVLSQSGRSEDFGNWGPVPLVYASARRELTPNWLLEADADAFPAPGGGGLFDGAARIAWLASPTLRWWIGGRYQVGGAQDPSFFNALRQSAWTMGLTVRL